MARLLYRRDGSTDKLRSKGRKGSGEVLPGCTGQGMYTVRRLSNLGRRQDVQRARDVSFLTLEEQQSIKIRLDQIIPPISTCGKFQNHQLERCRCGMSACTNNNATLCNPPFCSYPIFLPGPRPRARLSDAFLFTLSSLSFAIYIPTLTRP
jgi:hypothetical protein